ncbi:MAG TPA: hypothetical protein DCL44_09875 [Elusimicrobia bacterium]|nr:hypothetical protein [Elusimicrobiota bacterium]
MLKLYRRITLYISLLVLLPGAVFAGAFSILSREGGLAVPFPPPTAAAKRYSAPGHYLFIGELDLGALPAAPSEGSLEDREDLRVLYEWQARRTAAQCAAANSEISNDYEIFFGRISPFGSPSPAAVKVFFNNVAKDSVAAHKSVKNIYKRPRPFMRDAGLTPCLPRVEGFSYPSGHSAMSRLFALILSDLVPARRAEFMARADEAALYRLIGGVHHPTDLAAGKALADMLYASLLKQPEFVLDMKALRPLLRFW